MAKKQKKAARPDLAAVDMILAEEDLAAMRPALAVAPELVVEVLTRKRRLRAKRATKRAAKKKAVKARKSPSRKARKALPKKKKARKTARRK